VFILEIDLPSSCFSRSSSQISDNTTSIEARQEGGSAQDPSGKIITSWMYDVKFPLSTQFIFGSLTFATGEDRELWMLPPGSALERRAPTNRQAPWSLTTSSTSGGACSGLDSFVGFYIHTTKIVRGIPVMMSTLRPLAKASSSSSSAVSPDPDLSDDYPEIGISAYEDSTGEGRIIFMAASNGDPSHNSSSRYPTIGRSEASDVRTLNDGMIRNLKALSLLLWLSKRLRWRMSLWHNDRPATLEGNHPSATDQMIGKRELEATSSASGNHRLADNDARWLITQNRYLRECGHDREDFRNIIDDQRHHRARIPTLPRHSPMREVTPSGRGGFHALAPSLRQVVWPEKFMVGHNDKYDGSNNFEEFIQIYDTIIHEET
jgi:hypothetical protein